MNIDNLFLCSIFDNIPLVDRELFLEKLHYKTKLYKRGNIIAYQGDKVDYLHVLLEGKVKAEMISQSGEIMKIETIIAPNVLAPAFLFAENNHFPVDVTALDACELMLISKNNMMKQLAHSEVFLQSYMAFCSGRTHFLADRIKLLSIKTIKGKLAQYILGRSKNGGFDLEMNQTELAEYFGVTRPSLARCLAEMIDEQIITLEKKQGKILNARALRNLIMQYPVNS